VCSGKQKERDRMKYYAGIDLGGTNIAAGITDEDGNLLAKVSTPTLVERGFEAIAADMAQAARDAAAKAGIPFEQVASCGIGAPGAFDTETGDIILAVNLNWENVPLVSTLRSALGIPVYLGNDADCAALGEVVGGAAKDYDNALMITIGTGIGGGIIFQRKIFRGCTNAGTEPGHIPLIMGGALCGCGQKGCFEAYASCTALIRMTKEEIAAHPESLMWQLCGNDPDRASGRTSFNAAKQGDPVALALVDRYIRYLACGIAGLINVYRPEIIIVGGGVSNEGDYLMNPLNKYIGEYSYGTGLIPPPKAVKAILGNDAGIIGAAMLEKSTI